MVFSGGTALAKLWGDQLKIASQLNTQLPQLGKKFECALEGF